MKQKIICQKGKCFETDTIESEFDSIFEKSNLVDQIQLDIMRGMMR